MSLVRLSHVRMFLRSSVPSFLHSLLSPVVLLGLSSLFSRLLGVLRDHFLAVKFGALQGTGIYDLDTYYAAFKLPDLIYNLLIAGTISAAFVPIFSGYLAKNEREQGWKFVSAALNLIFAAMVILASLGFIFAPWLTELIAPGFSGEKLTITINLTRIMLLSPIIFGLSSIAQGIQNSFKTYFYYSLAPILYNLGIIAGILFLGEKFGVYGISIGVISGAFLHLIIQLPKLYQLGLRYRINFDYKRKDIQKMFTLMLPRIFGASATQITALVDTMIASTLTLGSITILNYAQNLNSLPMGIIGVSYAIVSFANLSELSAKEDQQGFSAELKQNINKILFLIIPAMAGMFIFRYEIVNLILRGGKFTADDAILTAQTLTFLIIGLFAQSLIHILARAFYALRNTKTPVKIGIIAVIVNILGNLILAKNFGMGVKGLALANSFAGILNFLLLIYFLSQRLKGIKNILSGEKIIIFLRNTFFMAIIILAGKWLFVAYLGRPEGFWLNAAEVGILSLIGAGIYFWISKKQIKLTTL